MTRVFPPPRTEGRARHFRWVILSLLLLATTINYVDRQLIWILAPALRQEIGWSELDYGSLVAAFTATYAIGLLVTGRPVDVIGTELGYATSPLRHWARPQPPTRPGPPICSPRYWTYFPGSVYLIALLIFHTLVPSVSPIGIA